MLELSACVEFGEDDFDCGFAVDCGVVVVLDGVGWDPASVVGDFD